MGIIERHAPICQTAFPLPGIRVYHFRTNLSHLPFVCRPAPYPPTPDVNYSKWKVQYGSKFFRYLVKPNRLNSNCFFFQSISSANPKSTFEKTLCLLPHKIAIAKQHSCNTSKIAHFIYYLLPTNVRRRLEIAFTKTCCGQLRLSGHMGSN